MKHASTAPVRTPFTRKRPQTAQLMTLDGHLVACAGRNTAYFNEIESKATPSLSYAHCHARFIALEIADSDKFTPISSQWMASCCMQRTQSAT